jgi:transposase, IS30 family
MGGPRITRELHRAVLDLLTAGLNPMQVAARVDGVSKTWVYDLHNSLGGVYRPAGTAYSERYLDRDQRHEIARLREAGVTIREVAKLIGVQPSTVSRELRRNADPKTGNYQPERADRLAWERQRRPKVSKIARHPALRAQVQALLERRFSPEQIAGRLPLLHPDNQAMRISHESIYQSIYVYPRGELKRELKAALRSGRAVRRRRGRRETRGHIPDPVSIHDRPEEVEGRLIPGHHEGDLIKGTTASNSAVGTIVERTTGYLSLLPLQDGHRAQQVADAVVEKMSELPAWFTKTLTWDRGIEMAKHKTITERAGIDVYFADPYSPYQRGSNENINGLLREYLPKGTDLSVHTADELQAIQDELNDRPRKRLGFYTPREALARLLEEDLHRVATTP